MGGAVGGIAKGAGGARPQPHFCTACLLGPAHAGVRRAGFGGQGVCGDAGGAHAAGGGAVRGAAAVDGGVGGVRAGHLFVCCWFCMQCVFTDEDDDRKETNQSTRVVDHTMLPVISFFIVPISTASPRTHVSTTLPIPLPILQPHPQALGSFFYFLSFPVPWSTACSHSHDSTTTGSQLLLLLRLRLVQPLDRRL